MSTFLTKNSPPIIPSLLQYSYTTACDFNLLQNPANQIKFLKTELLNSIEVQKIKEQVKKRTQLINKEIIYPKWNKINAELLSSLRTPTDSPDANLTDAAPVFFNNSFSQKLQVILQSIENSLFLEESKKIKRALTEDEKCTILSEHAYELFEKLADRLHIPRGNLPFESYSALVDELQEQDLSLIELWKAIQHKSSFAKTKGGAEVSKIPCNADRIRSWLAEPNHLKMLNRSKALECIDIENKDLKRIPFEINFFDVLKKISLVGNKIKQHSISALKDLGIENIWLCRNTLEKFPLELTRLRHLKRLDLSNNQIKTLPTEIERLTQLEYLALNNNKLRSLPASIGNLRELNYLELHTNRLLTLPEEMIHLKKLNTLDVRTNPLVMLPLLPNLHTGLSFGRFAYETDSLLFISEFKGRSIAQNPNKINAFKELMDTLLVFKQHKCTSKFGAFVQFVALNIGQNSQVRQLFNALDPKDKLLIGPELGKMPAPEHPHVCKCLKKLIPEKFWQLSPVQQEVVRAKMQPFIVNDLFDHVLLLLDEIENILNNPNDNQLIYRTQSRDFESALLRLTSSFRHKFNEMNHEKRSEIHAEIKAINQAQSTIPSTLSEAQAFMRIFNLVYPSDTINQEPTIEKAENTKRNREEEQEEDQNAVKKTKVEEQS